MGLFDRSKKEEYESAADQAISHYQQGEEAYQKGKYKQAHKEIQKAVELDPSLGDARQLLELIYCQWALEESGRVNEVIGLLKECIRVNPDTTTVHALLGRVYEWQRRIDEANQEYKEHLQIHPDWEDLSVKVGGEPVSGMRAAVADELARRMLGIEGVLPSQLFRGWSDIRKSIGMPKRRGRKTGKS